MRFSALFVLAAFALTSCSKSETMIGLTCPVTMHYDNEDQGRSEQKFVQRYLVNIKDNSVRTYKDDDKELYNACLTKACKISVTDSQIRIDVKEPLNR